MVIGYTELIAMICLRNHQIIAFKCAISNAQRQPSLNHSNVAGVSIDVRIQCFFVSHDPRNIYKALY